MLSIFLPTFRGLSAVVDARRWYVVACVCLLVVAVGLRFYNLPGHALWFDETRAALNARGDISDVVDNTRRINSSPILYPLALWAVQKAAASEFSVGLMPAVASALTVGALLSLLPRVGVARWAAFLAALLAALSVAAIEHAQDAREYSIDTLAAVMMIAGLLQYLRDGRRGLLCGALLAGPLLQYGLVLFGVAVIGAAALAPAASAASSRAADGGVGRTGVAAIWGRFRARLGLLLPIACFAAACGVSWAVTARYQWELGVGGVGRNYSVFSYLRDYYYQGGLDAAVVAEFAVERTWGMLGYHMPPVIAGTALVAFAAVALVWLLKRRWRLDAIALLAALAVGLAICAAVVGAYPYGGIRQCLYLGPIIFLAAGGAFHSLAVEAAGLARREWLAAGLAVVVAAAIALAGAWAVRMRQDYLYYSDPSMKQVIAALEEFEREGDAVYVSRREIMRLRFYKPAKPDNYRYGKVYCPGADWRVCVPEMLDEMFRALGDSGRIWLIHNASASAPEEIAAHSGEDVSVVEVAANGRRSDGWAMPHNREPTAHTTLHLITGFERLVANMREEWLDAVAGVPSVVADYDLYLQDDALYWAKQPCAPGDTDAWFFLYIYPEYAEDLSDARRGYGYDIVKFDFDFAGMRVGDKCVIRRYLPEYPIARIHTGQFAHPGGAVLWEADFPFDPKVWLDMYDDVVSGVPSAAADYDLYLREDALYYAKRSCDSADVEARFFLHIYPEDVNDLPASLRQYGLHNLDFEFHDYGALVDCKRFIRRALPGYAIARIHTGQFARPDGRVIWEADLSVRSKVWLDMYDDVVSGVPSAAADYDLYLREDALYYAKRSCDSADVEARFFLHIYPEDVNDLPASLRRQGFQNLDFEFHEHGLLAADRCVIRRHLPEYPIARIHTGQFARPDGAVLWEAELSLGR